MRTPYTKTHNGRNAVKLRLDNKDAPYGIAVFKGHYWNPHKAVGFSDESLRDYVFKQLTKK